ncbi:MAG TPA: hypothetical protein VIG64_00305 [Actinomycetota bacterium]
MTGTLHANPSRPVQSEIRMLRPTSPTPDRSIYSAGQFTPLRGGVADYAGMGMWVDASPHTLTAYGECFYEPEMLMGQVLPRELAFAPNCPTGENLWTDGFPQYRISEHEQLTDEKVHWSVAYSGALISGVGGWFDSASVVREADMVGLWMNFQGKNSLLREREEVK